MNLVFEDLKGHKNFVECPDINSSTLRRFAIAPLAHSAIYALAFYKKHKMKLEVNSIEFSNDLNLDHYIIPSGVNHHPNDWTDLFNGKPADKKSIFEYINPKFLTDLQIGNAMLMIDQSVEGYHTDWLWAWFHKKCEDYNISPKAIIYITGDQSSADDYNQWTLDNNIDAKLNIVPCS
jgi:hypothetical protein